MTIPSRPAPPPPPNSNGGTNYRIQSSLSTSAINSSTSSSGSRYTPTTNWDDKPFNDYNGQQQYNQINNKKMPPPRPPPPIIKTEPPIFPALKKPGSQHSVNILSNLFGTKQRSHTPPNKLNGNSNGILNGIQTNGRSLRTNNNFPPKLPPPPSSILSTTSSSSSTSSGFSSMVTTPSDYQLIDFHSPPSSPTLTQKSNSDCLSIDSFSSDSNNYNNSPNNGNLSQTESGFEDDFNVDCQTTNGMNNKDPWELLTTSKQVNLIKPPIAQKPVTVGKTSFYAFLSNNNDNKHINKNFDYDDNPLCNGKTIYQPVPLTMPTIIRPKTSPQHKLNKNNQLKESTIYNKTITTKIFDQNIVYNNYNLMNDDELTLPSPPSPPMPNCPPPPLPEFYTNDVINNINKLDINTDNVIEPEENLTGESYGIALYDYEGTQDEDLSFREHEKIYLIKKIDNDWMMGRNRRGCEGMIPINYIDIKIPIKNKIESNKKMQAPLFPKFQGVKVKALYTFHAEAPEDLELKENDDVMVLYEINSEWLFGRIGIKQGQFPANFIEFIPANLPKNAL